MKKLFYCLIVMIAGTLAATAASSTDPGSGDPRRVKAYFNYAVFSAPEKGTYIETYLTVPGSSCYFKKNKNRFQATVRVEISFSQNGKTIQGNIYNLNSAEIVDTSKKPVFTGVQRYSLKPGKYEMNIRIKDVNMPKSEELNATQTIEIVEPPAAEMSFSDVELVEAFVKTDVPNDLSKSGYDISPYVMRYYPESASKLIFYTESYNSLQKLGADGRFLFAYYVEGAETKEKIESLYAISKQKPAQVNPLLGQFDISELPTGEYNLVVEARNTSNDLVAVKKLPFTRISKVMYKLEDIGTIDTTGIFLSHVVNTDTLRDYIACLWPISSTTERDWQYNQIKNADVKIMQQYLYAFWINRDPKNPDLAWKKYRSEAVKVKKEFACGKIPGYMTDRGRVYLQYGAPSAAQQQPVEPDSYPYEIWQYYRIKDPSTGIFQSNKKFIFYNRELDGKCYELIHSDARGEIRDDRWAIKLKQRSNQIMNLDQNTPNNTIMNTNGQQGGNSYGSGADDLFQNPR